MSWDCDSDVLSMHQSVCSFVSNIAGGHCCGTPRLSGFGGFRKIALPGVKPYMILYSFTQLLLGQFLRCMSALK